jgi:hypothetical protein
MNINLSHPGLDARRKKKIVRERLHRFNWNKVSEDYEWIWIPIESESSIILFAQWISKQLISYPAKVILFDSQLYEISNSLLFNEFDTANLFKTAKASYLTTNNMEWMIEYSSTLQIARFGIMNI